MVFHNGSNYDYHFIIKEQKNLKKHFICLGENIEKYITFTVPIEKELTRIDKNAEEITRNICYILQVIDSAKFMARFIYLIIFPKKLTELNVSLDAMIKM